MSRRRLSTRAALVAAVLVLAAATGGCAGSDRPTEVATGQGAPTDSTEPGPAPSETAAPERSDPAAPIDPGATEAEGEASTTTVAAPTGDPGESPVEGLSAADLQEALDAPGAGPAARGGGPVAEPVALDDGRTVWRVRVPGSFPVRAVRPFVTVGSRDLGPAVVAPGLDALAVVTLDPTGLVSGVEVAYRWETDEPVPVGRLTVIR